LALQEISILIPLHYKIETMFMFNQREWGFSNLSVKINGSRAQEALAFIQSVWKKNLHRIILSNINSWMITSKEMYMADTQITKIVAVLAILAIIISCLGLFGHGFSYSAEKRVKEIGIRKVLGASVTGIVGMLSKEFFKACIDCYNHSLAACLVLYQQMAAGFCIQGKYQLVGFRHSRYHCNTDRINNDQFPGNQGSKSESGGVVKNRIN